MNTPFSAVIQFQRALLDAYEAHLAQNVWDEARLDEALKSMLAILAQSGWSEARLNEARDSCVDILRQALRVHCALGEQMLTAHREFICQYRNHLKSALRPQGDLAP